MMTPNHIRLQSVRGVGSKRFNAITEKLKELGKEIDDLFAMPADEIVKVFKVPRPVAEAIATAPEAPQQDTYDSLLKAKAIKRLLRESEGYPDRLKEVLGLNAPPILYAWGNLDLLNKPAVGFCGSRNVTDKGLEVTADTAKQIVERGWVVVSGHARGVDAMAHRVALENGGSTIIVLPEGILSFTLRKELKRIAKPEQLLIISEFTPNERWTVGNAMQRNNTIVALSDVMVLVEARREGGTFAAGNTALRLNVPLYVVDYQTPGESAGGNVYFLSKGAIALQKSQQTGKANITKLGQTVLQKHKTNVSSSQKATSALPEDTEQLPLLSLETP